MLIMPINKNELVVRFEPGASRLAIYRTIPSDGEPNQLMFLTEFTIPELLSWSAEQGEGRIGRMLIWSFPELKAALEPKLSKGNPE